MSDPYLQNGVSQDDIDSHLAGEDVRTVGARWRDPYFADPRCSECKLHLFETRDFRNPRPVCQCGTEDIPF